LSRKTDRFVGYENPVTDTISDPFNIEVILGVTFKLESVALDDEFMGFLFVMVIHAAASINPTTINKANGTISFIEGSVTRRMIFFNDSILQGTEALQFGFRTTKKKSKENRTTIKVYKRTPAPAKRQQNANTLISCFADREALTIIPTVTFSPEAWC
jgi:hypothetical protein